MLMKNKLLRTILAGLIFCGLLLNGIAQKNEGQIPNVNFSRNPYGETSVSTVTLKNSDRIQALLREGILHLSLDDAIASTLENNLDIELQRFSPKIAEMDWLRAKGGGMLRGLSFSVRQLPLGVGGPSSPLITSLGGGSSISQVPGTLSDLAATSQQETNLSILGSTPFSSGPAIPKYDTSVGGQLNWNHQEVAQTNPSVSGTNNLIQDTALGNFSLQRGFSTGTSLNLGYFTSRQTTSSVRSDFNPYLNGSAGLTVIQPLLQGFGMNMNRRYIRIASNNRKISGAVFRQQLIITVSDVIRLYWDLVSLRDDVKVKQAAVLLAGKLVEDDQAQVDTGTLPALELKRAQAELARTEQDLINARNLLREQELIFKNILTRDGAADPLLSTAQIVPSDSIQVPAKEVLPPVEELVAKALVNRPDLAGARFQMENSGISLEGSKNALRPQFDLVGSVQSNALAGQVSQLQFGDIPIPHNPDPALVGGFGTAFSQLFNGTFPNYLVGFQLNIPLGNRIARADLARDQLQQRQTEIRLHQLENQVRLEVQNALLAVERAQAAHSAARQTRQLQEEALSAEQERYAVGAATSFYVIQYERDLSQARSTEVAAAGAYAKAKAALDRVIGATLETNHISVDEALRGEVATPPQPLPAAKTP
jgi:outer membrane protein